MLFRRIGYERALALGLMVSQRNLGLMLAATAGALPPTTWLYFAMTQFPIHLSPYMLTPIARRLTARAQAEHAATVGRPQRVNHPRYWTNARDALAPLHSLVTSDEYRDAARQFPM